MSGGKITTESIDVIQQHPDVTNISISDLTQKTFEYFIQHYGSQFEKIDFWKCKLIEDFQPLESLDKIQRITFYWNQRVEKLWNLSRSRALTYIAFRSFTRLHDISDIATTTSVEELQFGDVIWDKFILNSLNPLQSCSTIRHLSFSAQKILDGRIEPLAGMQNLESLEFPPRLFTTEQVAWLKAHLPDTVQSKQLHAYQEIRKPPLFEGFLIIGRRKPFLDSVKGTGQLDKYFDSFNAMYHWFFTHQEAKPEDYSG